MLQRIETGPNTGFFYLVDPDNPHLGGNIDGGDPNGNLIKTWDYLISKFGVKSVLDVGCGQGHNGLYFKNRGCSVVGVEGLWDNCVKCPFPCVYWDLLDGPLYFNNIDLVWCREVVEHIPEEKLRNITETFKSGKIVAFTHALPNQGGHHHVNCQGSNYWIIQMEFEGYEFLKKETQECRDLDNQVLLVFRRKW